MAHEWKNYCPRMKEMCIDGHTKSMKNDDDGKPNLCAYWTVVAINVKKDAPPENIGKCSECWQAGMMIELIAKMGQARAETAKLSNLFHNAIVDAQKRKLIGETTG